VSALRCSIAVVVSLALGVVSLRAQDLSVAKGTAPAPQELAEPVRALLADGATTVTRGDNTLEFWWVKSLAPKPEAAAASAWSAVAEGSVVGALRVAKPFTDIRGGSIKPGVYTLRYALQPQDGDHMGVSPFREFLLVAPAADDVTAEPLGHKGAVTLAKKTIGKSHPAALSLDPPAATAEPGTVVTNDAGHKAVVFRVPAAGGNLTFGLILVGTIEHQVG